MYIWAKSCVCYSISGCFSLGHMYYLYNAEGAQTGFLKKLQRKSDCWLMERPWLPLAAHWPEPKHQDIISAYETWSPESVWLYCSQSAPANSCVLTSGWWPVNTNSAHELGSRLSFCPFTSIEFHIWDKSITITQTNILYQSQADIVQTYNLKMNFWKELFFGKTKNGLSCVSTLKPATTNSLSPPPHCSQ